MLTKDDNELFTRVGPDTAMGKLLRCYWFPFIFGNDLIRDGKPERVQLLGEDLLAFRDTTGTVGLIAERCPHRRASLYFGRNEECGIRCIYHGWKFDLSGACVDQPSEPETSSFKEKVHIAAYPCVEHGGFVWTYMGPLPAPPLPRFEWMELPPDRIVASMRVQESNWGQALEGDFDQSHVSFLHSKLDVRTAADASITTPLVDRIRFEDRHPIFEIETTPYGLCIAAGRKAPGEQRYWRLTQHLMPNYSMTGPYGPNPKRFWRVWVPMDDRTVVVLGVMYHPLRALTDDERAHELTRSSVSNIAPELRAPASSKPYGRFRPLASLDNDFMQDRDVQRTTTYSGIPEFWAQDAAMQVSMGAICDRTSEHLGTSDLAIIALRKRLLTAAKALRDHGTTPSEVWDPECYYTRSDAVLLPADAPWFAATAERRAIKPGINPDCP
jgi:phenylpropionate dioxygenase-like ring-hydroxylating dioxygenase large terminal subunit